MNCLIVRWVGGTELAAPEGETLELLQIIETLVACRRKAGEP